MSFSHFYHFPPIVTSEMKDRGFTVFALFLQEVNT